ncbi:MAG: hypothetical protein GX786_01030 [Clostridiales bacterium]|nr:hypothetical protein [Clostridiales bacterium]
MGKISPDQFINGLLAIEKKNPTYRNGGVGLDGTCDCIGLAIGAFREAGIIWQGLKGTNYAARYTVTDLQPFKNNSQIVPGMWIFTGKQNSVNLPDKYQRGGSHDTGDYLDYSHVYFVVSVSPLVLIHCTKDGKIDGVTRINKVPAGRYIAYSNLIDYEQKGEIHVPESESKPPAVNIYPVLRKGSTGSFVAELQLRLHDLGYDVGKNTKIDGKFGEKTYSALRQFQAANGLYIDGIAGGDTWSALVGARDSPSAGEDDEIGDYANLTIRDLPKNKLLELKKQVEAQGYETEVSHG